MALNIAKMTGSESSNDWQCSDPMALEIGRLSWGGAVAIIFHGKLAPRGCF